MSNSNYSRCIKCGKDRILIKTWTEKLGGTSIIHNETSCPDPECQKEVDTQLMHEDEKRQASIQAKLARTT